MCELLDFIFPVLEFRVIDGDSVEVVLDRGWDESKKMVCRISGVDTPERNTAAGQAVKRFVEQWCIRLGSDLRVQSIAKDKFGGRFIGDLLDKVGCERSLSETLLTHKLAKPYAGGIKLPFTDDELARIVERVTKLIPTTS